MPNAIINRTIPPRVAQALGISLVIALGAFAQDALASVRLASTNFPAHVVLISRVPPPPPIVEPEPGKRKGFEWSPGFWKYDGIDYKWIPGNFVAQRPGQQWKAARWQRSGESWHFAVGHWEKAG